MPSTISKKGGDQMQLTTRDKRLFELLNRYHVLSSRQVKTLVFANLANTNVFRRLRLLESKGLILRSEGLPLGESAWTLRSKGAASLATQWLPYSVNKNTLHHDVTLSELRLALESVGLGKNWKSEQTLKRETFDHRLRDDEDRKNIPDGLLPVPNGDVFSVWAVELELSLKAKARYAEIFRRYKLTSALRRIWYVVPSHEMGKLLLRRWRESRWDSIGPILSYSLLSDVVENPFETVLISENGSVRLSEVTKLIEPLKSAEKSDHSDDQGVISPEAEKRRAA
jgi:hypothetical protein